MNTYARQVGEYSSYPQLSRCSLAWQLKAFSVVILLFTVFSVVFYYFARRLGYVFSLPEFVFFFFVYNPLWLTISIASLLRVIIWKNGLNLDWKF